MEYTFLTPPWDRRSKVILEEIYQQARAYGVHVVIVRLDTH